MTSTLLFYWIQSINRSIESNKNQWKKKSFNIFVSWDLIPLEKWWKMKNQFFLFNQFPIENLLREMEMSMVNIIIIWLFRLNRKDGIFDPGINSEFWLIKICNRKKKKFHIIWESAINDLRFFFLNVFRNFNECLQNILWLNRKKFCRFFFSFQEFFPKMMMIISSSSWKKTIEMS